MRGDVSPSVSGGDLHVAIGNTYYTACIYLLHVLGLDKLCLLFVLTILKSQPIIPVWCNHYSSLKTSLSLVVL